MKLCELKKKAGEPWNGRKGKRFIARIRVANGASYDFIMLRNDVHRWLSELSQTMKPEDDIPAARDTPDAVYVEVRTDQ